MARKWNPPPLDESQRLLHELLELDIALAAADPWHSADLLNAHAAAWRAFNESKVERQADASIRCSTPRL